VTGPATLEEAEERAAPTRRRGFRPAPVHRWAELEPRAQLAFAVLVFGLALVPLLSAAVVLAQGWRPTGDNALIGLRVNDVLTGHWPLIGQPTTGENFGSGIATSHPGPIEFYLVAPFVAVLGPSVGLALGAALINSVAFVGVAWLSFRRGGMGLMVLASVASVAMARSLGGNLLHDPVSSNVGSVAAFALLFAAWSIVAGDLRVIPAFVVAGTFVLQDHLSYLGTGAPVVALAVGLGIWWAVRIRRRGSNTGWLRLRLIVGAAVGLVLWSPVLIDEVFGDHNLTSIWRTFTGKRTPGEGLRFALERLAEALAPWPLFSHRVAPLGYLHRPAPHELVGGYLVLAAVIALGVLAWRRRDTTLSALAAVTVIAALAGTYTAIKLPVGAGIQASNLRWMWTVSAFAWVALAWMAWQVVPSFSQEVVRTPAMAIGAATIVVVGAIVVGSADLATDRDGRLARDTSTLIDHVEQNLPKGTYRIRYAGGSVVVSVGPALVHDLDHRGDTVLMDVGPFTRAYAEHRGYRGQKTDGTVLVTAEASAAYPAGTRLLARQEFVVNRKESDRDTIRVYLLEPDA
jgi:hypothetical protein